MKTWIFLESYALIDQRRTTGGGECEVRAAVLRRFLGNKRTGRFENRENTHRLIIISCSNFYFQADKCARGFYVKCPSGLTAFARYYRISAVLDWEYTGSHRPPLSLRRKVHAYFVTAACRSLLSRANSPRRVNLSSLASNEHRLLGE